MSFSLWYFVTAAIANYTDSYSELFRLRQGGQDLAPPQIQIKFVRFFGGVKKERVSEKRQE